jgi:TPR repeat protein
MENNNPTWFIDRLTLYQNANSSPEAVKRNFLIRIAEFELIVADLRNKRKGDPVQHELILGRRGSGKSTLLRRIQIEIDEQPDLQAQYVAINLAEEQGAIYRLSDLWYEVVQELAIRFGQPLALRSFDTFEDEQAYARYLHAEIRRLLQAADRRVVLLLDNLDRILENFNDDAHLFREMLVNHPTELQIIGGSTRMNEHFWRYDLPFYDFFRRHRLEGLTFEEVHTLLNHWAAEMQLPQLHDYALRHRGRVMALRILTDGLPRALQYFIQVLLHDSELYGFDYLKKVMDRATPLYQERLNNLTPPLRKIVQELAFLWEAAPTKTLVERARIESKRLSADLKQLERYGIVETLSTGKKNHLYRLSERFFNMWLIVTQGNPDQRRRAKYLTLFLEGWYDERELRELAQRHLGDLEGQKMSYDKALVLSKGLSQSKYVTTKERDALIDLTKALNPADVDCELPRKYSEIFEETHEFVRQGQYEKALKVLEEIENEEDGVKFRLKGYCYAALQEPKIAEQYYLQAIEKGDVNALNNLAVLYNNQGKTEAAEQYYLQAIEKGHVNALNNLAVLYSNQDKSESAEKYYLQAIEKGHVNALYNLALLYSNQGKIESAENYYLQAIEKGDVNALNNLAILYNNQEKTEAAEQYYLQAIEKGHVDALNNLAVLYYKQNRNAPSAVELMQSYQNQNTDEDRYQNLVILELWSGHLSSLREKVERVLNHHQYEGLNWFIEALLHHQQAHLLLSLFESEQHGKALRERYELLYYAALLLAGRTEDNLLLRIPPELLPTVEDIVAKVRERQAFYTGPASG